MSAKNLIREALVLSTAQEISKQTGGAFTLEYPFAKPQRRWRSDIAWPDVRVALEIDGGTWISGRHNRPSSSLLEMEKNNGYAVRNWLVFHAPWTWIEDGRLIDDIVTAIQARKG